jgi:hypothetical protein
MRELGIRGSLAPSLFCSPLLAQMEVPWYVDIIKTGSFKEQAPYDSDWYFTRAASIARTVYLKPGIGVQKFRKVYGALIPFAATFPAVSSLTLSANGCALPSRRWRHQGRHLPQTPPRCRRRRAPPNPAAARKHGHR